MQKYKTISEIKSINNTNSDRGYVLINKKSNVISDSSALREIISTQNREIQFDENNRITGCPHKEAKYYAKGMCVHCYHSFGRTKLATNCPHTDKTSYAKNMCVSCY